jgi:hypothetical protein
VSPQVTEDTELVFEVTVGTGTRTVVDAVRVLVRDVIPPANDPDVDEPQPDTDAIVPGEPLGDAAGDAELAERELLRDVHWSAEQLRGLRTYENEFGFGDAWRELEQAEAWVQRELDDTEPAPTQDIVLRDTLELEVLPVTRLSDVKWPASPTLVPVARAVDSSPEPLAAVQLPVYPAWHTELNAEEPAAQEMVQPAAAGVVAAVWGLLRGLAGTRYRGREDE